MLKLQHNIAIYSESFMYINSWQINTNHFKPNSHNKACDRKSASALEIIQSQLTIRWQTRWLQKLLWNKKVCKHQCQLFV